jgi:hypothetical protein
MMDPNANIKEIREIVGELRKAGDNAVDGISVILGADTDRLVELWDSLDQWLSKGGFLPDAWKKGR